MAARIAALASAFAAVSMATALADCRPHDALPYGDVESIFVERSAMGEPHYDFIVDRQGRLYFSAVSGTPVVGTFQEASKTAPLFRDLNQILRSADFFSIRLKPYSDTLSKAGTITVRSDGPVDQISVLRCGVLTTVATNGGKTSFFLAEFRDAGRAQLLRLVEKLQRRIFAWNFRFRHALERLFIGFDDCLWAQQSVLCRENKWSGANPPCTRRIDLSPGRRTGKALAI